MKVKVITYSSSVMNKVVRKYMELTAVNESVYYALLEQHPNNREMDELCLVLRVGDTYFDYQDVHRISLRQPAFIEAATDFAEHFIERVEQLMQRGEFLRLSLIEVCMEQGMDTVPLMAYREQRERRRQQEAQQKEEARELERQKAWQAEQERLEFQKRV